MDSVITMMPLASFLAEPRTGRDVVEQLYLALKAHKRVLVWGPRVGAIELAEDLFDLWPSDETPVVAVNLAALWTRTREGGQDSGWVPWVETTPSGLVDQVLSRQPAGVLLTYLTELARPTLPALTGGPWGLVTAIAANDRLEAQARAQALGGEAAGRFDLLVGVSEVGTSTWISEVHQVVAGQPTPVTRLEGGRYVTA